MLRITLRQVAFISLVLLATGCGVLDVSDPTAIEERELGNAAGAQLLRGDALRKVYTAASDGALLSGLLADEFFTDKPAIYVQLGLVWEEQFLDQRQSIPYEQSAASQFNFSPYGRWLDARRAATVAMPPLRAYGTNAQVGEMYALRGYAELRLAEDICSGFPLHAIVDRQPVFGPPLTTDEAFEHAVANFDTALALATDSARILHFARVGQARALVGLGRFAEAAAVVEPVPDDYTLDALYSAATVPNAALPNRGTFLARSVANQEGGTGINFVAADDPRVPVFEAGTAVDGITTMYGFAKYPDENAPIVLASGIEARLIEAEAALHGNSSDPQWLVILNDLRAASGHPELTPLADPGTTDARVDLLFRERAFWLFGTGHRLGDLRRLIRLYGQVPESVFPTGPYRLGDVYGMATSIPFSPERETPFSPGVTGCTSR